MCTALSTALPRGENFTGQGGDIGISVSRRLKEKCVCAFRMTVSQAEDRVIANDRERIIFLTAGSAGRCCPSE